MSSIKLVEAKQLYQVLGGNDSEIINAGGSGVVMKVRSAISKLLKNDYDYHEKAITKDAKKNEYKKGSY